ncbi:uncharacterized protein LOC125031129 [Penaeus chinensis]|uniref:uncharacterized protein LOC125031129 n=1 Tax=Penaeus chinensis TaxID=139456 RepID=UPI001FB5ED31|nr:uncharacterized protein LOC125031129 [Penaeus chinensis]XP_047477608.1 uncharacterized protein LOC125031129 [Penaeus chinensis]XP_047477609.1 uncharacterized protein LOC125031129 [Penaeus chinensis]XP_047477610.1 uncharacterized protein LOC125031129 [Penaeus chinensis]XP_047477612.1 uncharacterized protein LOC125031129 [Penaeus chinensis]XP_047477613.1 uncharacterized protein LOC125031129 [Penaeus chinensis]
MAGMIERIFPINCSLKILEDYVGYKLSSVPSLCIIGPAKSLKTALLMQAAVTEGEAGGQVLFMAPQKLARLPPPVHGMPPPSSSAMNNIRFLYADCTTELYRYLASLHMVPEKDRPSLIIIDDLHTYSTLPECGDVATQMVNAARILSLAQESARYCSSNVAGDDHGTGNNTAKQCSVLAAWTQWSSDPLKHAELEGFARTFCHHVWTLHENKKGSTKNIVEYNMVQDFTGATFTLNFSGHHIGQRSNYILFHELTLEEEEEEKESKEGRGGRRGEGNKKGRGGRREGNKKGREEGNKEGRGGGGEEGKEEEEEEEDRGGRKS